MDDSVQLYEDFRFMLENFESFFIQEKYQEAIHFYIYMIKLYKKIVSMLEKDPNNVQYREVLNAMDYLLKKHDDDIETAISEFCDGRDDTNDL